MNNQKSYPVTPVKIEIQNFKTIGIAAVAAAAQAIKPKMAKSITIKDIPSMLRKEHFVN